MNGKERGKLLRELIFKAYEAEQEVRQPTSVRPSSLGNECGRAPWYDYHWASPAVPFEGRMLRLFATGHSQEDRLIADVKRVGGDVLTRDPDDGSKQIPIRTLQGHMNGFLDGIGHGVPYSAASWGVVECKSHNKKSFKKLLDDGVEVAKPEHNVQMQIYLEEHDLEECLYIAVCKDDDDIYCEFVPRNREYHARLKAKAEMAAFSPRPPQKINAKPEFFKCKFCDHSGVCHRGELPERTCRTCREAVALPISEAIKRSPNIYNEDGSLKQPAYKGPPWYCNLHEHALSLDEQRKGCAEHRYNPGFIDGQEIGDRDGPAGFEVVYTKTDGTEYIDRGPGEARPAPEFNNLPGTASPES